MAAVRVIRERTVKAPAELVYDCIADYEHHHGNILPKEFSDLKVVGGPGRGAGTAITFKMKLAGRTNTALADVTEPEPGHILVESDRNSGIVTTFTVEPATDGTLVRFDTVWNPKGLEGLIGGFLARRLLPPIYDRELAQLERYAQSRMAEKGASGSD